MTTNYTAKVSDFGQSKVAAKKGESAGKEMEGTPIYMAPEIVTGNYDFGPAADVYSFGVLLFAMAVPKGDVFNPFRDAVEQGGDADAHLSIINRPSQRKEDKFDKDKATSMNIMKQVGLASERAVRTPAGPPLDPSNTP